MATRQITSWIARLATIPLILAAGVAGAEERPVLRHVPDESAWLVQSTRSGRPYRAYVDAAPGEDISDKVQDAIDRVRSSGGAVILPPGDYRVSKPICLAGTLEKFPQGNVNGVMLNGNGAVLTWVGPDEGAILDLPSPYNCGIKNITLLGERGRYFRKLVGIDYRAGIERGHHGGKNNRFESISIHNVGIGIQVGGLFGPDLVGGTFIGTQVIGARIGYRLMGQNVTSMVFVNPLVSQFEEAGFQIKAFGGRQIRSSDEEPRVEKFHPRVPGVLMDADDEREIFQKDLPAAMTAEGVTYPTWWTTQADGRRVLRAGGGGLDVTIYGLLAHSSFLNSWAIDTNWGNVRVYSARIEGMGGIFRSREPMALGNYANVLMDLATTSVGGVNGNAIEMYGQGPLYLIGGTYQGNVAVGSGAVVYNMGARFGMPADAARSSLLPLDFDQPLNERIELTDETRTLPHSRGEARVVKVKYPQQAGITQLPAATGARVHELIRTIRVIGLVKQGDTVCRVALDGLHRQSDDRYQVSATPDFDAGSLWIADKRPDEMMVQFANPAPGDARIDLRITRGQQ